MRRCTAHRCSPEDRLRAPGARLGGIHARYLLARPARPPAGSGRPARPANDRHSGWCPLARSGRDRKLRLKDAGVKAPPRRHRASRRPDHGNECKVPPAQRIPDVAVFCVSRAPTRPVRACGEPLLPPGFGLAEAVCGRCPRPTGERNREMPGPGGMGPGLPGAPRDCQGRSHQGGQRSKTTPPAESKNAPNR